MPESIDEELVKHAQKGDRSALEQLAKSWEQSVYRIAWRIVGTHSAAEEIRQTLFLRIIEHPEKLPEESRLDAWIRQCAANESISYLRRQHVRKTSPLSNNHPGLSASPVQQVAETEDVQRLKSALEKLEPAERAMLSLRFDENLSFREIGEILDRPPSTIKSHYARLLSQLHSHLKDSDSPHEEINHHV